MVEERLTGSSSARRDLGRRRRDFGCRCSAMAAPRRGSRAAGDPPWPPPRAQPWPPPRATTAGFASPFPFAVGEEEILGEDAFAVHDPNGLDLRPIVGDSPPDPASRLSAKSANQTHQSSYSIPVSSRPGLHPRPAATAASSRDPVSGAPPTARPHPQGELRTGWQERRRPGRQERRRRATLCSAPRGVGGGPHLPISIEEASSSHRDGGLAHIQISRPCVPPATRARLALSR